MAKDWERLRAVGKGAEKLFDEGKAYCDLIYCGKWKDEQYDYVCSVCGKSVAYFIDGYYDGIGEEPNFCPNCGADMREPQ